MLYTRSLLISLSFAMLALAHVPARASMAPVEQELNELNTIDRARRMLDKNTRCPNLLSLHQSELAPVVKYRLTGVAFNPKMQEPYLKVLDLLYSTLNAQHPMKLLYRNPTQSFGSLYDFYFKKIKSAHDELVRIAENLEAPYKGMFLKTAENILPTFDYYEREYEFILHRDFDPSQHRDIFWHAPQNPDLLQLLGKMAYRVRGFSSELVVALERRHLVAQNLKFRDALKLLGVNLEELQKSDVFLKSGWTFESAMIKEIDIVYRRGTIIYLGDVKFSADSISNNSNDPQSPFRKIKQRVGQFSAVLEKVSAMLGHPVRVSYLFVGFGLPENLAQELQNAGAVIETSSRQPYEPPAPASSANPIAGSYSPFSTTVNSGPSRELAPVDAR